MAERVKNLEKSWEMRSSGAREKAMEAIHLMRAEKVPVNFHSVHARRGVSKNYLYKDQEIRRCIEEIRKEETETARAKNEKYDKTSKSKDVIIEAKDRRIAKLEEENRRLRAELEVLRGLLYDSK